MDIAMKTEAKQNQVTFQFIEGPIALGFASHFSLGLFAPVN
jgi:hypothetical protein